MPYSIVDSTIENDVNMHLLSIGASHCNDKFITNTPCIKHIQAAYLNAIFSKPLWRIIRLFVVSGTKTMITGGATRITNYLGIYTDKEEQLSNKLSYKSLQSRLSAINNTERILYLIIFVVSTGFAFIARIFGIWGFITTLKYRTLIPFHLFYLLVTLSFLMVYSVISTSRFRAPLEPILMLYTSIGITFIHNQIKSKYGNRRLRKQLPS